MSFHKLSGRILSPLHSTGLILLGILLIVFNQYTFGVDSGLLRIALVFILMISLIVAGSISLLIALTLRMSGSSVAEARLNDEMNQILQSRVDTALLWICGISPVLLLILNLFLKLSANDAIMLLIQANGVFALVLGPMIRRHYSRTAVN